MVSGIGGLGKFNPLDMKETSSRKSSSSFDSASSREDSIPSNSSSTSPNKSLEKSNKPPEKVQNKKPDNQPSEKKSENSEFNKKVESYSKEKPSDKSSDGDKSAKVDSDKLDKKHIKESQNEVQNGKQSEIPQMAMLQGVQPLFVNQQAQPVGEVKTDADLNVKVSNQSQPVLKFMKAMQENFGISPQQIMKALGQMPSETLMQSPHQAMTPLFEKLGLQPKEFTKAQILYTEMLTDMEKTEPETFQGKLPLVGAGAAGLGAMSAKSSELPAQMIERPMTAGAPKSTLDQLIEQKIARRAVEPQNMQGAIKAPQAQANIAQVFKIDPNQMSQVGEVDKMQQGLALDKLQQLDPNLRIQDVKIAPNKISEQFASTTPILGGGAAIGALAASEGKNHKNSSEDDLKDQLSEQMAQMPTDKKVDGQFAMDKLGAPVAAGAAANHQNQLSNENVEKLITGSQSLIKKGGGEMKIQLNPEGLGKIHLSIKVEDGQVGVQMVADTHEAKKLLETSMNDLKIGLAEHKLNLNHTKVDVSEQASQNMNQSHDFKREEARDFLGQFRQFNESFRQGANDLSGVSAYKKSSQASTPDIQPMESRRSDSTKSGGLYLVA